MDVVVLGCSHETAPIEIRERLAFAAESIPEALAGLVGLPGVPEGMILSTCNRVELYAATPDVETALSAMRDWLAGTQGISPPQLEGHLYAHSGMKALKHIFRVVSSLDSLIVGEPQIAGQVKEAYQAALVRRAAGGSLNRVLHKAFSVAKRVRTETGIATHAVSVSYAAVELAKKIFGSIEGKTVLLIGAGEMGELAARHLQKNGAREILVANRTYERAVELSKTFSGTPVHFEKVENWLPQADIVVSAAGGGQLLGAGAVAAAVKARRHRPVFLIDIAVPRSIDPACNGLDDVYLYGIDDLRGVVDANLNERRREAARAEVIVETEAAEFAVVLSKVELGPTIGLLSGKLEAIRKSEVGKSLDHGSLKHLGPAEREAVEKLTRALIAKIAHDPIASLKDGLLDPDTLRATFNLAEVEAVPSLPDVGEGEGAGVGVGVGEELGEGEATGKEKEYA